MPETLTRETRAQMRARQEKEREARSDKKRKQDQERVQEALKRATPIFETLTEAGVPFKPYARAPITPRIFTLGLTRLKAGSLIRLWPGADNVNLEIPGFDPDHRQAVLVVDETAAKITARAQTWGGVRSKEQMGHKEHQEQWARSVFPFTTPEGTKYKVLGVERSKSNRWSHIGTIEATTPASHRSFLMGFDETDLFISELPSDVPSVDAAHALLRPKGLRKGAIRQGEWFFEPLTPYMRGVVEGYLRGNVNRVMRDTNLGFTGHIASTYVRIDEFEYVCGTVTAPRHAVLDLPEWRRVRRNTEITEAVRPASQFNRTRSWD